MIDGLECESRLVSREKQGQVDCKTKEKKQVRAKMYGLNLDAADRLSEPQKLFEA